MIAYIFGVQTHSVQHSLYHYDCKQIFVFIKVKTQFVPRDNLYTFDCSINHHNRNNEKRPKKKQNIFNTQLVIEPFVIRYTRKLMQQRQVAVHDSIRNDTTSTILRTGEDTVLLIL